MTETILLGIGFGLAIPLLAWILKTLYDANARQAADDVRWAQQTEYWRCNAEDHNRAFQQISDLKKGQTALNRKLDQVLTRMESEDGG